MSEDNAGWPNQRYGWVREDDGSWSLYSPDGSCVVASRNNRPQVPVPVGATDVATKGYVDGRPGGGAWGQESTAKFAGSGSPVGVVTPSGKGDLYVDTTTPALWQATGATSADWQAVAGGGSQPVVYMVASAFLGATFTGKQNNPLTGLQDVFTDGDRVFVAQNGADGTNDGIWIARAGAWERAPDMPAGTVIAQGTLFSVAFSLYYRESNVTESTGASQMLIQALLATTIGEAGGITPQNMVSGTGWTLGYLDGDPTTVAPFLAGTADAGHHKIINLHDPEASQDADTMAARDAAIGTAVSAAVGAVDLAAVVSVGGSAGGGAISNFATLTPSAAPVVPLTDPTVQNVIDALVAIGLITQSD